MEQLSIRIERGKKIYFASDFHLGIGTQSRDKNLEREKKIVRWMDEIKGDCQALFLLGDLFDFWFEYGNVVPKGHIRFTGKLAELCDQGISVYVFPGNHDMWMFGYLADEIGVHIFSDPVHAVIDDRVFMLGHGDGLGPGDGLYKVLKKIFRNGLSRFFFRWLHPDIGVSLAQKWSKESRISKEGFGEKFKGDDEYLVQFCTEMETRQHYDYYVFGHRHLPLEIPVSETSKYINLGEWVHSFTYGCYNDSGFVLKKYKG